MGTTIDNLKQECKYCYREVDASGLEAFRCTNKTVNMETSWCRPKNANEPCSICEYCKPREEIGMTIDDDVKQKLLDSLSKEPTMVISTAYAYAKNYVAYGEDITKAWTTAVQQASILEQARQKAWVEAYDSFKKEYEARLKADKVAMLTEIQLEIEESCICTYEVNKLIQEKINELKGVEE